MPVLLVRHARAKSRQRWEGDDLARPLTKAGRTQARALVGVVGRYSPTRVLSSPSLRCVQTVEPLAAKLSLPVETHHALAEGSISDTLMLVRQEAGASAVLCTHGDVIPEVLHGLNGQEGLDVPRDPPCAKGSTWVLEAGSQGFTSALYIDAPDPGSSPELVAPGPGSNPDLVLG